MPQPPFLRLFLGSAGEKDEVVALVNGITGKLGFLVDADSVRHDDAHCDGCWILSLPWMKVHALLVGLRVSVTLSSHQETSVVLPRSLGSRRCVTLSVQHVFGTPNDRACG